MQYVQDAFETGMRSFIRVFSICITTPLICENGMYIKLNWLWNHMRKVKSIQASISISSCAEMSKPQFFPESIIKGKNKDKSNLLIINFIVVPKQHLKSVNTVLH